MAKDGDRLRLKWRTGQIGCLLPICAFGTAMFGAAAFGADFADDLGDGRRWRALISMSEAVSIGGLNVPLAALALYLAYETFRFAWRWADEDALWTDERGLHFHGSLFRASLGWGELRGVATRIRPRAGQDVTVLSVGTADGRTIEVSGIEEAEAAAFAAAVSERIAAR